MIKKVKYLVSILIIISLAASTPYSAFASEEKLPVHPDSEVNHIDLGEDNNEYIDSADIQLRTDGYYYWKVESKKLISYNYGGWRNGPSGKGPGTVTLSNSSGVNRSVTNTISGSYTKVSDISASLGVTIGVSKTYTTSYSVTVPSGKRYQIIYRPRYKYYKIVQRKYYKIDGHSSKTSNTKTCYVKVFANWDYSWKKL